MALVVRWKFTVWGYKATWKKDWTGWQASWNEQYFILCGWREYRNPRRYKTACYVTRYIVSVAVRGTRADGKTKRSTAMVNSARISGAPFLSPVTDVIIGDAVKMQVASKGYLVRGYWIGLKWMRLLLEVPSPLMVAVVNEV